MLRAVGYRDARVSRGPSRVVWSRRTSRGTREDSPLDRRLSVLGVGRRRLDHEVLELVRQRVYGIACGYADCNDAARLAQDPGSRPRLIASHVWQTHSAKLHPVGPKPSNRLP